MVVDGSAKSHELSLVYDEFSLSKLDPPLVLQEFVNHGNLFSTFTLPGQLYQYTILYTFSLNLFSHSSTGGVLFKVYIVGEAVRVVRRFSLPDVNKRELLNSTGVFQFPRVSCAAASADDAELDPSIGGNFFSSCAFFIGWIVLFYNVKV